MSSPRANHYVVHELGVGCGYDGDAFEVIWLDESRPPLVCNLSGQGTVPAWIRERLPDNAVVKHLGRCEEFVARHESHRS